MNTSQKIHLNILRTGMTRIKSAANQPSGAKSTVINSGKGTVLGSTYQGFKHAAKAFGFYKDIEPYLPETSIKKYTYKPHKRTSGYLGKALWSTKKLQQRSCTTSGKQQQKCFLH